MDLVWLIELAGEAGAAALGGLAIGVGFGAFAQRSRFCLRAAAVEFARGKPGSKLAIWLLTFAAAVSGTQVLIGIGALEVGEARQLASVASLSGALVGGLIFGVGMVLARGCASRLLVLSATGNLRALLSGLIFAVVAQASLRGFLAPVREWIAAIWTTNEIASNSIAALAGLDWPSLLLFALFWFAAGILLAYRAGLGFGHALLAVSVGVMVPLGWWFTYSLSLQTFEPVQIESISFTGPSADTLMLFLSPPGSILDFDVGLVPGVFLGSFLAAWLGGELKLQGFENAAGMRRYILGAVLMGFGGMLAGGCAVGAGVTGGAIFALTSWIALTAIWVAASLTDWLVDRRGTAAEGSALASVRFPAVGAFGPQGRSSVLQRRSD